MKRFLILFLGISSLCFSCYGPYDELKAKIKEENPEFEDWVIAEIIHEQVMIDLAEKYQKKIDSGKEITTVDSRCKSCGKICIH